MSAVKKIARQSPDIEIRSPLGGRLVQSAICGIGTWVAIAVIISLAGKGTPWALLAVAALCVWIYYFYRLVTMSVVVRDEAIEIRNLHSTHRLTRDGVTDVGFGKSSIAKSPNQTVVLMTDTGGSISLDACARSVQSRWKRRRVEDFKRRLEHWASYEPPAIESAIEPVGDEPETSVGDSEEVLTPERTS